MNLQTNKEQTFSKTKLIGLISAALIVLIMAVTPPVAGLTVVGWRVLSLIACMVILWVTEPVPIGITALLPVALGPFLGLGGDVGINVWSGFASPAAIMVIGMFFLSAALVKWNLHKRIALTIISAFGGKPLNILFGFILATSVISAFMSNTTCTAMMMPLAIAVLTQLDEKPGTSYSLALILSVPYAASIGGIATTIGSGTNVSAVAIINEMNGLELGFIDWFQVGGPFSILMIPVLWGLMTVLFKIKNNGKDKSDVIAQAKKDLGPLQGGERLMFIYFIVSMVLLMFRAQTIGLIFPEVDDASLFMSMGFFMFIVPVDLKKGEFLMDLKTARGISWDTFLLIAGGLTMGGMFTAAGLADWLAGQMTFMAGWSELLIMIFLMLIVAFISELASNQVVALAFLPVAFSLATSLGYNPLFLQFAVALSASFAFMMPSGTPPNALAYASGYFEIKHLAKTGLFVKLACCIVFPIVIFLISTALSPLI